jgi:hypothetical protein
MYGVRGSREIGKIAVPRLMPRNYRPNNVSPTNRVGEVLWPVRNPASSPFFSLSAGSRASGSLVPVAMKPTRFSGSSGA